MPDKTLHPAMNDDVVLLVEDDPNDVTLAQHAMREVGFPYRIVIARDGAEALDYLFCTGPFAGRDRADTPLLILLDLKMPRVGGLEVLRRLKADPFLKHVTVAVLTSSREERDQASAGEYGANLYIRKPTSFDDFLSVIRQVRDLLQVFKNDVNPSLR